MIEQVAKAISRLVPVQGSVWSEGHGHDFPREYSKQERALIRQIARVAIEALREPTEAMWDAADAAKYECLEWSLEPGEGLDGIDFGPCWEAMIDAALSPERGKVEA